MKEKKNLWGILGLITVFALVLTGCPPDAPNNDPGLKAPSAASLPKLPDNAEPAATEGEARALLAALGEGYFLPNLDQLQEDSKNPAAGGDAYDFSNKKSEDWTVTGKGSQTATGPLASFITGEDEDGESPDFSSWKPGTVLVDAKMSDSTKAELTGDKIQGRINVLKGSKFEEKRSGSMVLKLTNAATFDISISGSGTEEYAYAWTVSFDGKAAKVILSANAKAALSNSLNLMDLFGGADGEDPFNPTPTCSGSLKVYGAGDKEVYAKTIAKEDELNEALGYFGTRR